MVSHMVKQKAEQGHPLSQQQTDMLTNHLLSLWSAPIPPTQPQIVNAAGAMLRSFSAQQGGPSQPAASLAASTAPAAPVQAAPIAAPQPAAPAPAALRPAAPSAANMQATLAALASNPQMAAAMAALAKSGALRPGMAGLNNAAAMVASIRASQMRPQGPAPRSDRRCCGSWSACMHVRCIAWDRAACHDLPACLTPLSTASHAHHLCAPCCRQHTSGWDSHRSRRPPCMPRSWSTRRSRTYSQAKKRPNSLARTWLRSSPSHCP
jgi:hypothetical protein